MKTKHLLNAFLCCFFAFQAGAQQTLKKAGDAGAVGRDGAAMFAIGDNLYFGAGLGHTDFWEYNTQNGQLTQKKNVRGTTNERAFVTGFSAGNKGYVCLGSDGTSLKSDLWEYDPTADTWTQKADFPGGTRNGAGVFVVNNKAYIAGGADDQSIYGDFWEYDPAQDKWTEKANLGYGPAIFPSGFSIGNKGYLIFGQGQVEYGELWQYDPASDAWTDVSVFPGGARQAAIAFSMNGKAYMGCGQSQYKGAFRDMYEWTPSDNSWRQLSDLPDFPKGLAWGIGVAVGSKSYIGFGWDFGSTFFKSFYEYSPLVSTGIAEVSANSTSVYPNPCAGAVKVSFTKTEGETTISIYDITGRQVLSTTVAEGSESTDVNISGLNNGVYTVVVSQSNTVSVQKLDVRN